MEMSSQLLMSYLLRFILKTKPLNQSGSPTQDGQDEKAVKSRWRPWNGCDGQCMVKNFNNSNSFFSHSSFTRNQHKIQLNYCYLIFFLYKRSTITAISWLPPGFHNFFTLAILCRLPDWSAPIFTAWMAVFE